MERKGRCHKDGLWKKWEKGLPAPSRSEIWASCLAPGRKILFIFLIGLFGYEFTVAGLVAAILKPFNPKWVFGSTVGDLSVRNAQVLPEREG